MSELNGSAQSLKTKFAPVVLGLAVALCSLGGSATNDPTQPDNLPRPTLRASASAPVLASVLIGPGRKLAVINGHLLEVGESAAGLTLIEVTPGAAKVRLSSGQVRRLDLIAETPSIGGRR